MATEMVGISKTICDLFGRHYCAVLRGGAGLKRPLCDRLNLEGAYALDGKIGKEYVEDDIPDGVEGDN